MTIARPLRPSVNPVLNGPREAAGLPGPSRGPVWYMWFGFQTLGKLLLHICSVSGYYYVNVFACVDVCARIFLGNVRIADTRGPGISDVLFIEYSIARGTDPRPRASARAAARVAATATWHDGRWRRAAWRRGG